MLVILSEVTSHQMLTKLSCYDLFCYSKVCLQSQLPMGARWPAALPEGAVLQDAGSQKISTEIQHRVLLGYLHCLTVSIYCLPFPCGSRIHLAISTRRYLDASGLSLAFSHYFYCYNEWHVHLPRAFEKKLGKMQLVSLVTPEEALSSCFHVLRIMSLDFVCVPTSCSWFWHRNKERRSPMLKGLCDSPTHFLPTLGEDITGGRKTLFSAEIHPLSYEHRGATRTSLQEAPGMVNNGNTRE